MTHRVLVTGLGQVSALGTDLDSFSDAVFAGRSGVRRLAGLEAPGVEDPTVIPTAMANAAAGVLAGELRLKGENLTLAVACSSATHAIGQAFRLLRAGGADVMLAGGADAPLTPIVIAAWNVMRVLAPAGSDPPSACRPFSRGRQGMVLGEGAAFLVLETLEHARRESGSGGANAQGSRPTPVARSRAGSPRPRSGRVGHPLRARRLNGSSRRPNP